MSLKIHYLVLDTAGPIQSGVAGKGPPEVGQIGSSNRYRAACGAIVDGHEHRATGPDTPWAVRCAQCKATAEFQAGADRHGATRPGNKDLVVAPEDR